MKYVVNRLCGGSFFGRYKTKMQVNIGVQGVQTR